MLIFKISALAVLITVVSLVLKQYRPDISMLVTVAGGIVILLLIVKEISGVFAWFDVIASKTKINKNIISSLLKIIGVGYVAEFTCSACEDAGNKSMAEKVALASKIVILALSLPVLSSVVEAIMGVL